jgi:hypothetical protein
VVIPQKDREEIFSTLVSQKETIEDAPLEDVDTEVAAPENFESTPIDNTNIVNVDTVQETPSPIDIDISDDALTLPVETNDGPGARAKVGELGGRSKAGRQAAVKSGDATSGSEAAVQSGLKWLAKHQDNDGSWSFKIGNESTNAIDNRMGATGMALLAFLGSGNTHKVGDYTKTVRGGLTYLISNMKVTSSGGDLRGGSGHHGMYSHGICSIALCEAYALSKDKELKQPTQLAIDFIVNAQHAAGGWRYEPGQAGDTSVVGWQIMALKSAKIAKLKVPSKTIGKATAFLNSVQSDGGAQYGYDKAGAGQATNAIGLLCRMYLGWTPKQQALVKGVEVLGKWGPQPGNMYYSYYATQVMHHWGGEEWKKWNVVMREHLVKSQDKEGEQAGSWSPANENWGKTYGGRLYTTCMSIMTLEVYYRHLPLYQRQTITTDF